VQLLTFPTFATGFAAVIERTRREKWTDPAALNPWHLRDNKRSGAALAVPDSPCFL